MIAYIAVSRVPSGRTYVEWLDTILALIDSPMLNPHLLTHTCTSHSWSLVSKTCNTFGIICKVVLFFINGAVPVPMFGGPLELCVQDLWQYCLWSYYSAWLDTPITKPHLTFLSDVMPGLGLNSCNAPYVYNLADNKNVSMSNNDFVIWMLHMNQKPSRLQTSSRDQINNIRHVIWIAHLVTHLWQKLFQVISLIPI